MASETGLDRASVQGFPVKPSVLSSFFFTMLCTTVLYYVVRHCLARFSRCSASMCSRPVPRDGGPVTNRGKCVQLPMRTCITQTGHGDDVDSDGCRGQGHALTYELPTHANLDA